MKLRNSPRPFIPLFALICRLTLAIIFFYAGVEKIIHPQEFAVAIHNYQLLPDCVINFLAIFLPWLEVLIAASLVSLPIVRLFISNIRHGLDDQSGQGTRYFLRLFWSVFGKYKLVLSCARPFTFLHVCFRFNLRPRLALFFRLALPEISLLAIRTIKSASSSLFYPAYCASANRTVFSFLPVNF